mmetsp:Transcript_15924/g.41285  ORF Transcript_15924/g.41285 Transcript_15924/m.41285 type:complete len:251 (-) Transcript_15924:258-1010(-)
MTTSVSPIARAASRSATMCASSWQPYSSHSMLGGSSSGNMGATESLGASPCRKSMSTSSPASPSSSRSTSSIDSDGWFFRLAAISIAWVTTLELRRVVSCSMSTSCCASATRSSSFCRSFSASCAASSSPSSGTVLDRLSSSCSGLLSACFCTRLATVPGCAVSVKMTVFFASDPHCAKSSRLSPVSRPGPVASTTAGTEGGSASSSATLCISLRNLVSKGLGWSRERSNLRVSVSLIHSSWLLANSMML